MNYPKFYGFCIGLPSFFFVNLSPGSGSGGVRREQLWCEGGGNSPREIAGAAGKSGAAEMVGGFIQLG